MIKLSSQLTFGCFWLISTFVQLVQACPSIMRGKCTQRGATERKQHLACVYGTFLVHFNMWNKEKFFQSLLKEEH